MLQNADCKKEEMEIGTLLNTSSPLTRLMKKKSTESPEKTKNDSLLLSMSKLKLGQEGLQKKRGPDCSPSFAVCAESLVVKRHSHQESPAIFKSLSFYSEKADAKTGLKTLLVYPEACLDHHTGWEHQENRDRLLSVCGKNGILRQERFGELEWAVGELPKIRDADVLRVHDAEYIEHLKKCCKRLPKQVNYMEKGDVLNGDFEPTGSFDFDSSISEKSYDAACAAAGAVCYAVDRVMYGTNRNAFVAVRPPGHHAGPKGCVSSATYDTRPEMCSCGFCLINNVAIGAAYALTKYGPSFAGLPQQMPVLNRVAIIDFDIHHGNGTEEILRGLIPHETTYPLPTSWKPLTYFTYKPWVDEHDMERVFFSSIHLYDGDSFYPGSGEGPSGDSPQLEKNSNIINIALDQIGPSHLEGREKLSQKQRKAFMIAASHAFRSKIKQHLLPSLEAFRPELIFLSSGFDGHADDFYYYLTEADFEWLTVQIKSIASKYSNNRIVSVLEGGYNLTVKPVKKAKSSRKGSPSHQLDLAREIHSRPNNPIDATFGSLPRSIAAHVDMLMA